MWTLGRQGTGYYKCKLFQSSLLKLDLYLLKYPPGSEIPIHSDPVPGRKHYRVNLVLLKGKGGEFWCERPILLLGRLKIFRSDFPHSVSKVEKTRLVLSLGYTRKNKQE